MNSVVCIFGRPNVGKSTLFNRLVGCRKSIVDDSPGTTRDRTYDTVEWCSHTFNLIDTGGYITDNPDKIEKIIADQVRIGIKESDAILFVVDVQVGLSSIERKMAKLLQQYKKPVIVVANKSDNHSLSYQMHDFHALNVGPIFPISAIHGSGTGELLDAIVEHLPNHPEREAKIHDVPKIALIGRPNQGKSTFLNSLLGQSRSIVSPNPHTTRTPVNSYYRLYGNELLLIDTAGIRKKSQVSIKSIEFYGLLRSIKTIEEADVCLLFVDAQTFLTDQDKNIINLIIRRKKGLILLANKWDKIKNQGIKAEEYKKVFINQLPLLQFVPIMLTSGLYKKGIYQTVKKAIEVHKNLRQKLPTSHVNQVVLKAVKKHSPPITKGKSIKIKYATQLPTSSPTFALFCNLPQYISETYKRYLENSLRNFFPLEGVPVTLVFRTK